MILNRQLDGMGKVRILDETDTSVLLIAGLKKRCQSTYLSQSYGGKRDGEDERTHN